VGTTDVDHSDSLDEEPHITPGEVAYLMAAVESRYPSLALTLDDVLATFAGVRPVINTGKADPSAESRDHVVWTENGLLTVTGGKLTTFRLMAERAGDLVAARLGNREPCRTAVEPLPALEKLSWTEPGHSARAWIAAKNPADAILCECEMVPKSTVDTVLESAPGAEPHMPLRAIGVRSRIGKGTCQGSFCAIRVTSHLYDRGTYGGREGLALMRDFLSERYKGTRPVLWGAQMPQAELAETLHCGLLGLDLIDAQGRDDEPQ